MGFRVSGVQGCVSELRALGFRGQVATPSCKNTRPLLQAWALALAPRLSPLLAPLLLLLLLLLVLPLRLPMLSPFRWFREGCEGTACPGFNTSHAHPPRIWPGRIPCHCRAVVIQTCVLQLAPFMKPGFRKSSCRS